MINLFRVKNIFFLFCLLLLSYCSPVHKGYKFEEGDDMTMQKMVANNASIQDIINKFGSPSFVNSPFDDVICYIDADGKKIAFNRFYKPTYHYICIEFKNDRADKIVNKTLTTIEKEKMTKYKIDLKKPL